MKKFIPFIIIIMTVVLCGFNFVLNIPKTPNIEKIQVDITGSAGNEIYAEFILDSETVTASEILPVSFTFQSSKINLKAALIDYKQSEPFHLTVKRENNMNFSNSGKGVTAKFESNTIKYNILVYQKFNHSSSASNGTMTDEEIDQFLLSMKQ